MGNRDDLFSAVRARVQQIISAKDYSLAFEPGALDEARQLAQLAGDDDLGRQAINLLGLAGFPHVIGTMWEIEDASAAEMAGTCYTALHAGQGAMDTSRAAQALHQAVRRARENLPGTPSLWACYLHVGA